QFRAVGRELERVDVRRFPVDERGRRLGRTDRRGRGESEKRNGKQALDSHGDPRVRGESGPGWPGKDTRRARVPPGSLRPRSRPYLRDLPELLERALQLAP